jgi:hypothetical protein
MKEKNPRKHQVKVTIDMYLPVLASSTYLQDDSKVISKALERLTQLTCPHENEPTQVHKKQVKK